MASELLISSDRCVASQFVDCSEALERNHHVGHWTFSATQKGTDLCLLTEG